MRIAGKTLEGFKPQLVVFERPNDPIAFSIGPVVDYAEYDQIEKQPEPPERVYPGGTKKKDIKDKGFVEKLEEYLENFNTWAFLKSLSYTKDLEFDQVDINDPSTYKNLEGEMLSVLTKPEYNILLQKIHAVNSVTEDQLEKARDRFLALQRQRQENLSQQSSQQEESQTT